MHKKTTENEGSLVFQEERLVSSIECCQKFVIIKCG